MFNTFKLGSNSQTLHLNAPSTGILQKSNPKSIFVRFQKGSNMEDMVFPSDGSNAHIHKYEYPDSMRDKYSGTNGKIEVVVLQVLIFGDNNYLVEVVESKHLTDTPL